MNYLIQHIRIILDEYNGTVPLHHFLKDYFKSYKKLGSRDRKAIREAVYGFFRVFMAAPADVDNLAVIKAGMEEQVIKHHFLDFLMQDVEACTLDYNQLVNDLPSCSATFSPQDFIQHLLHQPLAFIRNMELKKDAEFQNKLTLIDDVQLTSLPHIPETIASFPNSFNIGKVLKDKEYIIQDLSSQQVLSVAKAAVKLTPHQEKRLKIWDVCSGAGGKSILLKRLYPQASILASDIRRTILNNLESRVKQYGIGKIKTIELDVQKGLISEMFDLVVCDVPCTGSGTWGRTPEQFAFFDNQILEQYTRTQLEIVQRAYRQLKGNGYLVYITCSIFEAENESQVRAILDSTNLHLVHQELINGIESKADSLFVAIFTKNAI